MVDPAADFEARQRCIEAQEIIAACIPSELPENVIRAATRAVAEVERLRAEIERLRAALRERDLLLETTQSCPRCGLTTAFYEAGSHCRSRVGGGS